ncbi:GntR family transcriptional regulator [Veronia pacifica]|uniref:HTH gntR-type domain-containing protein n=1 Tax=Veronia pacifica TaxID=1080227 RepID=A0A1C3EBR6_9GAMM|nr:GntR family transcriptional regulator [Veronia pacifica]ODA30668.1 hypothetical protein A8L45_19535 [Veronia pacifica]
MKQYDQPTSKKRSSADEIYDNVVLAIFERKLSPGVLLKEEEMCEVFNARRATVRTALQRLASKKLVDIVPNSGAYVAKPNIKESKEIFEARRLIERTIVIELAKSFTSEKEKVLQQHVCEECHAEKIGENSLSIRLSGEFHLLLGELSEKTVLTEALSEFIFRTSLIISMYKKKTLPAGSLKLQCHHEKLIDAIKSGDGEKAAKLMDEHLLAIESQLMLDSDSEDGVKLHDIFS